MRSFMTGNMCRIHILHTVSPFKYERSRWLLRLSFDSSTRYQSASSLMLSWFRPGHGLPHANPSRVPPNPTLFPNYMQNTQGLWLRRTEWWPRIPTGAIKGVIFIVSGLGEHSGRYDSVALRFNEEGYVCFSVDNQGMGGSEGVRLYVDRFSDYVDDFQLFINHTRAKYPELTDLPRFLLGHSLGGLIATHIGMGDPQFFCGVIVSGPAYGTPFVGAFLRRGAGLLSSTAPKLPAVRLDTAKGSTNAPVQELIEQDPFFSSAPLRARFGNETFAAQDYVMANANTEKGAFSFLVVHGEKDVICSPEISRAFYEAASSTDKDYKLYPGAYHDVLTEVCRKQVLDDVMEFIMKRTV